jgi:predicted metal-dependent hydrolase
MFFSVGAEVPRQLALPFSCDEDSFRSKIEGAVGKAVALTFTDNATSMISVRAKGSCPVVRIHRMFLSAGMPVIIEIADFIRSGRRRTPLVRSFIRQNKGLLKRSERRKKVLRPEGRYHDLIGICRRMNTEYFEGRVDASVTWGAKSRKRAVRCRTLGSYNGKTGVITISPVLDRKDTPRYFVEFIVYHEMLHADIGVKMNNGRRLVHTGEFRLRERMFRDYEKAIFWEKKRMLRG